MSSAVKLQINRGNAAESMNLKALRNFDPLIGAIQASSGHCAVYRDLQDGKGWQMIGCEGALFVVNRKSSPRTKIVVLNRKGLENFAAVVDESFTQELHQQHCMFRSPSGLWCAWIPDANEAKRVHAFLGEAARRAKQKSQSQRGGTPAAASSGKSSEKAKGKGKKGKAATAAPSSAIAAAAAAAAPAAATVKKAFSYAAAAGASTAAKAAASSAATTATGKSAKGKAGKGKGGKQQQQKQQQQKQKQPAGNGKGQQSAASSNFDVEGSKMLQNMLGIGGGGGSGGAGGGALKQQQQQQQQQQQARQQPVRHLQQPGMGSPGMYGQALPFAGQQQLPFLPSTAQWQQQQQQQQQQPSMYGTGMRPPQQAGGLMHLTKLQLQETLINLIRDDNFISLLHREYMGKVRQQQQQQQQQ